MSSLSLVTPPVLEPISLQEAKEHCRIDLDDEDALIGSLIIAARQHVEDVTGRQLITATWALTLDGWPWFIDVPKAPLLTTPAVAITYLDTNGTTQTLATTQYRVEASTGPTAGRARIMREYAVVWPTLRSVGNAVTITFTAGYGTSGDKVPMPIRQAMLLLIGHWYRNRESVNVGNIVSELPQAFDALIGPYRTWALQAV
jgi:uncharacterized phiE125 gp8 family phage protein